MKILTGQEALIAVALGLKVRFRTKSELIPNREWHDFSDRSPISMFLSEESNQMFEWGISIVELPDFSESIK